MIEDLKLLLGLEDTDKKDRTAVTADSECHKTAAEISSWRSGAAGRDGIHHIGCFSHSIQPDRLGRALLSQC